MKILGISSGHDSGAAIIEDGRIVCAINEERLSRRKNHWGPPLLAIRKCLEISGVSARDLDLVAMANLTSGGGMQQNFTAGTFKKRLVDWFSFSGLADKKFVKWTYLQIFGRTRQDPPVLQLLRELGVAAPCEYFEHHAAHAASALYTSPFSLSDRVLIVTVDSSGDGLSTTISTVDGQGRIVRRHETSFFHSPSVIYSYVTHNLGFKYLSHEGKITGLAAYGNPEKTLPLFRRLMEADTEKLQFRTHLGCWGRPAARKVHIMCQGFKREDIAAGVQRRIEEVCCQLVAAAAKRYNCDKICLAGGIFANVRLNQKLLEMPGISAIFVHPHMGDGGEAVGSALAAWAERALDMGKKCEPSRMHNAYLGPEYSDVEIKQALDEANLPYTIPEHLEQKIAEYLAQGKIVARFSGRMEYGPRALGNRSILYPAVDRTVNDWLNKQLARSEFMPFAPILLASRAADYMKNFQTAASVPAEFMTITYAVTDRCALEAPAIVHVDGTARPQIVYPEVNPSVAKVLEEYEKLTGKAVLVNTSFNMHEEPIVCSPQDAIRAFLLGHLDILAIGNYIVENQDVPARD
jgi:carbamoyltransferase